MLSKYVTIIFSLVKFVTPKHDNLLNEKSATISTVAF